MHKVLDTTCFMIIDLDVFSFQLLVFFYHHVQNFKFSFVLEFVFFDSPFVMFDYFFGFIYLILELSDNLFFPLNTFGLIDHLFCCFLFLFEVVELLLQSFPLDLPRLNNILQPFVCVKLVVILKHLLIEDSLPLLLPLHDSVLLRHPLIVLLELRIKLVLNCSGSARAPILLLLLLGLYLVQHTSGEVHESQHFLFEVNVLCL